MPTLAPTSRFRRKSAAPLPRTAPMRVASGARIDPGDRAQMAAYRRRMGSSAWVDSAFIFNAMIPEIGFAHDYVRDSLSRVTPIPAILSDDPDQAPIPIDKDTAPDGLDPDLCDQLVQRLAPFPAWMGRAAQVTDIGGECWTALLPDKDEIDGEICRVFSSREILVQGDEWRYKASPDDTFGTVIPKDAPLWRIWQPHPEFAELPDSHMVRLNDSCKALLAGTRLINAFFLSRLSTTGKLLFIADEFSFDAATSLAGSPTEDAGDGEGSGDPFMDDLMAAAGRAINNPEGAEAVMNMIIRGPRDLIKDGVTVIDIKREMEEVMQKLRDELREAIATGINLPREIILGIGATNHWNAEEIKQQAWLNHLEPRAYNILAATTEAYYRPALLENDVDPEIVRRCILHYDASWYLGSPDRAESADYGYDNMLISGESWRSAKNYSEDDAPDDDEIAQRIQIAQQLLVRTTIREDDTANPDAAPAVEKETISTPGDGKAEKAPVPDTPDGTAPDAPKNGNGKAPKIAAAVLETADGARYVTVPPDVSSRAFAVRHTPTQLDALGDKLVGIERDLRTRLLEAADSAVAIALGVAGRKVKMKLGRKGVKAKAVLAQIDGIPDIDVVSTLGRPALEAFDLKDHELLAGALIGLKPKYHTLVKRAQHAAAKAAATASGAAVDYDALDERTETHRDDGWTILAAGLTGLTMAALYNPHPEAPTAGEFDESALVPPGLIRAALDRAGGAPEGQVRSIRGAEVPQPQSPIDGPQDVPGGATAGPEVLGEFYDQMGITSDAYTWVYGDAPRTRGFEPHEVLDGQPFAGWDDEVLANPGDWPPYDFLFPSDHDGCGCDSSLSFTMADDATTFEPGLGSEPAPQLTRDQKADAADAPRRSR